MNLRSPSLALGSASNPARAAGLSLARLLLPLMVATVALPARADAYVSLWDGVDGFSHTDPVALSQTISSSNAGVQATASGSADLASGTLRSAIVGQALVCCATNGVANSNTRITDTLTFHGAGPSVLVEMAMLVDGTFAMSGTAGGTISVTVNALMRLQANSPTYPDASSNLHLDRFYQTGFANTIDGYVNGSPGSYLDKSLDGATALLLLSVLMPTERPISFTASLSNVNNVAAPLLVFDSDFSHTAQVSMALPEGYGFTSASGVFLSTPPVPEPASPLLMLAGLAAIAGGLRRRRGTR